MNEQQFQEIISQIPPEVMLMIVRLIMEASPEELQQLVAKLEQAAQGGGQGAQAQQGGGPPTGPSGEENLYGPA